MVKKTRVTLSNGLPLVVIEIPGSNSSSVSFWTKAGTRTNPEGKEGLSHFLEHVLLTKSKNHPTDSDLGNYMETNGIWKNGFTGRDTVSFEFLSPSMRVDKSLKVMSELILDPIIDKEAVDQEREIIKKEIVKSHSQPNELIWHSWFKAFFAGTPLETTNLGNSSSLDLINKQDLRKHWENYYLSKKSLILVTGGINNKVIKEIAEDYFGKVKLKSKGVVPIFNYKNNKSISVINKKISQSNAFLSFRIPEINDSDFYALLILRFVLAVGWGSRIVQRLRVKEHLIYTWNSQFERYIDTRSFGLGFSTEKTKFNETLESLCDTLFKLKRDGITNSELDRAVNFMEGLLVTQNQTSEDYLSWYGNQELHWPDKVESIEKRIIEIKKIKKQDVVDVARKYIIDNNWNIGVIGDIKEKDVEIKIN